MTIKTWYRIAFTEARLPEFSDAIIRIHDGQRFANWPVELQVSVTETFVSIDDERVVVIYFPPTAAESFKDLINELGGKPCLEPAPDGLLIHGT